MEQDLKFKIQQRNRCRVDPVNSLKNTGFIYDDDTSTYTFLFFS